MNRRLSAVLWNRWLRGLAFWLVVAAVWVALDRWVSFFDVPLIGRTLAAAMDGQVDGLSTQEFAFSLSAAIGAFAFGLLAAFILLHGVAICTTLWLARGRLPKSDDRQAFAAQYESVHQAFADHPLIGHAWREFDETLVMPQEGIAVIRNTIRPQAFLNIGMARDHLFGLKMMGNVPGYFVGIGLLLTFIGLVLALHKAAAAVNSTDTAAMQAATRQLLQVATFKFATSIAGLGASILLSFSFRACTISIEGAFDRFCRAVERRLKYTAPQSLTAEMNTTLAGQLTELKQINSADFFSRMGQQISPHIESAFASAMAPVTANIDEAVNRLADNSHSGVSEMVARFTEGVQGAAGTELRDLAESLRQMQAAMLDTQRGIHGTGEDFGRRMSDAAENLNRLVSQAGDRLGESAEQSRAVLVEAVEALRTTFMDANRKVDEGLAQAATGASSKIEEAMTRVLGKLETQIDGLRAGLGSFQEDASRRMIETQERMAHAQSDAATLIGNAGSDAAKVLQAGISETMQRMREEIDRFVSAMRFSEAGLQTQASALHEAVSQSRAVADAFSRTAQDVRAASAPLTESGIRIAGATDRMSESVAQSTAALDAGQVSSRQLAAALVGHIDRLKELWSGYATQFEHVDAELGRAVAALADAARRQGEMLAEHAGAVDQSFGSAISKLNPFLNELNENAADLGDAVESLRRVLLPQAAE